MSATAPHLDEPLLAEALDLIDGTPPPETAARGCILPPTIKYVVAGSAGIGRALNAFGSLDSINDSLTEVFKLSLPFASPDVQVALGKILGFTFCSGNALMSSMSEVGKILETVPSTDDHGADASSCQKSAAWALAGINGLATSASAFNGLKMLFSGGLSGGLSDGIGGFFALAVFISSTYFNTKKNLQFSKMNIPDLRDTSLRTKYMTISGVSMISNGAMTAYQVSKLLCGLSSISLTAGASIPVWIIAASLFVAALSDANLYYTQIPATKITFAKAEAAMIDQIRQDLAAASTTISEENRIWLARIFPDSFDAEAEATETETETKPSITYPAAAQRTESVVGSFGGDHIAITVRTETEPSIIYPAAARRTESVVGSFGGDHIAITARTETEPSIIDPAATRRREAENPLERYRHITIADLQRLQSLHAGLPKTANCDCSSIRNIGKNINKFCQDMADAPVSTLIKGIGHILIDAAWALTPANSPDTLKTLIELCCGIIRDFGNVTSDCDWINTNAAAYGILAGGIVLGIPAAVMAKSYRRDDAYRELDSLVDGMLGSRCCVGVTTPRIGRPSGCLSWFEAKSEDPGHHPMTDDPYEVV